MILYNNIRYQIVIWVAVVISKINSLESVQNSLFLKEGQKAVIWADFKVIISLPTIMHVSVIFTSVLSKMRELRDSCNRI